MRALNRPGRARRADGDVDPAAHPIYIYTVSLWWGWAVIPYIYILCPSGTVIPYIYAVSLWRGRAVITVMGAHVLVSWFGGILSHRAPSPATSRPKRCHR